MNSTDLAIMFNKYRTNPRLIQQDWLNALEAVTNGEVRIVDPTNPFVFLGESAIAFASAQYVESAALDRLMYAALVENEKDLYRFMSDVDYLNLFATPSNGRYFVMMSKEEVNVRAIDTGVGGIRKITIPRNTKFKVAGYTFSMQYPIDIRIMAHGGLQVVYDTSIVSPLLSLESNVVDHFYTNINGTEMLVLSIPVQQFDVVSYPNQISDSTGFTTVYSFTDQYYYCRVYRLVNDEWVEMKTTHSDQVFNPNEPTAQLRKYDNTLAVHIPPVYISKGLITGDLRVDIYTTKGALNLFLSEYEPNQHEAEWVDLEASDNGVYSAPLSVFTTMLVYSDSVVSGGANGVGFEALREQVINNAYGEIKNPITDKQLINDLSVRGYQCVREVDNITKRTFLATRGLPESISNQSLLQESNIRQNIAPGGCLMGNIIASMETLGELDTVAINGDRLTILPTTLFTRVGGVIRALTSTEVAGYSGLTSDALVTAVNNGQLLYTPFHYVWDASSTHFDCRGYYLDDPAIEAKQFIDENDSTGLEVGSGSYSIVRIPEGYRLFVRTRSGDNFKALDDSRITVQMSYIPKGETARAHLNGVLIGQDPNTRERLYQFDMVTTYDINANNEIYFNSFKMFTSTVYRELPTDLLTEFDIVYVVTDYSIPGMTTSGIDSAVGVYLLADPEAPYVGVSRERYRIRLGNALMETSPLQYGLWSKARSIVSSITYETWEVDVPRLYTEVEFERDGNGHIVINYDGDTVTYNRLHEIGDPYLDSEGNPTYLFYKGQVKRDQSGNPIPKDLRKVLRDCTMFFIDGRYYFATDSRTVEYRRSIPQLIVGWIVNDISFFARKVLELTEIYLYPKTTIGELVVLLDGGEQVRIASEQRFVVTLSVSVQTYKDATLRASLTNSTIKTLNDLMKRTTISQTDIQNVLKTALGNDVYGIKVLGLAGERNASVVTVMSESDRLTIGKEFIENEDGTLSVQDSILVKFEVHQSI